MKIVKISVRSLVEFILREGNIDNRTVHDAADAMQEGSRLHRKIQRSQGSEYHAEVPLSYVHEYETETVTGPEQVEIVIDGRADGIIDPMGDGPVFIDEIKGTYRYLDKLESPDNVHLAQAKCYAYMYACQNNSEAMGVRMTYVNIETEDTKKFNYILTFEELDSWFHSLVLDYESWVSMEIKWKAIRNASIKAVDFPYEYRKGQKELVTHVYHTIAHGRKLFLEAPTGVGKTIATVFPAIKAMGEQKAERLFYLTAKTITRTVAVDTIGLLRKSGLEFKSIVITAKDKICFMEERLCNPEACPYARGHFDRINDAMFDILTNGRDYDRATVEEYARKHNVCPFELSLDVSLFCDGIICDYNYLFDPHVYLKRFFGEGKEPDSLFLIDEAHNLVDRGRKMYSASLCKEDVLALKNTVKVYDHTLAARLEKCNKELLALKRMCDRTTDHGKRGEIYNVYDDISSLVRAVERLSERLADYLENHDSGPVRDEVLQFYFVISHFLYIYEIMDDKYVTCGTLDDRGSFVLRLYCIDPSGNLKACMSRGVSSVLFSATLLPIRYFKSLLGGDEDDYEVYAESTFDSDRRGLYLAEGATTKYTERGPAQYGLIASYIHDIVAVRQGRYMVFFPSYAFMEHVKNAYESAYGDEEEMTLSVQGEHMTEEEREEFLARFSTKEDETADSDRENSAGHWLIGFCVLGGIFSEGIDLQGESLIGSIIVGTGIPMVCTDNELIKDYFDERDGDGMKYAYIYPGFNKVLQAAGRVIRTHEDVGIVALLDYRFAYASYRELYPREWNNIKRINAANVSKELDEFWTGHDKN